MVFTVFNIMNGVQRNVSKIYIVLFCRENLLFFCYKSLYNVLLKGRFAHWYFQILISLILQNIVSLESDAAIKKKNTTENKCVKQDLSLLVFNMIITASIQFIKECQLLLDSILETRSVKIHVFCLSTLASLPLSESVKALTNVNTDIL